MNPDSFFRNMPVKRKLLSIVALSVAVAMPFAVAMAIAEQWFIIRAELRISLVSQARILAENSATPLLFGDRIAAEKTLGAVGDIENIEFVEVRDGLGGLFVRYARAGIQPPPPRPMPEGELQSFGAGRIEIFQPVVFGDERIGTIYLRSTLMPMYQKMAWNTAALLAAMLGGLLIAAALAARLHPVMTGPIAELVGLMERVSREKNYALRVDSGSKDELGTLGLEFNAMLAQIQERTTQLLTAQEELVRKEKLAVLGQVAGSVGHELRNPLGVMSNAVYFLETVLTDADETVKEYLGIIKNEIAGSERIVSDLLDSVRTKPPHPETAGVAELIEQTLNKLTIPPSVSVRRDIPDMLPPVVIDPLQIHQVFRNLISNGIDAMPDGGTLEIRAVENRLDGTITVSVCDSGIGMTPEQLGHLFQPLFTTKARGIGLGLVVVKNLTEANGGKVDVQSEHGVGTTFTVTLPAAGSSGFTRPTE